MSCAVISCKNRFENTGCSFFTFPKDEATLQKWISFCRRRKFFNTKYARICDTHFVSDDFENSMQFEMGFTSRRRIKAGAVPTIFNPEYESPNNEHNNHVERQTNNEIVEALLKDYEDSIDSIPSPTESTNCIEMDVESEAECLVESLIEIDPLESEDSISSNNENIPLDISYDNDNTLDWEVENLEDNDDDLPKKIRRPRIVSKKKYKKKSITEEGYAEKLAAEKEKHSQAEKRFLNRISSLSEQLKKSKEEAKNVDEKLSAIFSKNQIKQLRIDESKWRTWNEEDITQSITLYASGAKTYMLLLQKGFPLPSVCVLRNWTQQKKMLKDSMQPKET